MTLSIHVDTVQTSGPTGPLVDVHFFFNEEYEKCSVPVGYWSRSDYVRHWIAALSHVIETRTPGALVTSIHDPAFAANLVAWVAYPLSDGVVKVQQRFLLHNVYVHDRTGIRHDMLPSRGGLSSDIEPVSEWTVSLDDLAEARTKLSRIIDGSE
ncbi:hypothetical protein [Tuwongella immobilis]|uniref:CdiI C-terminal domain-containing protein n=1 Tax=Tuwongella immobilis TaxID=692036 RepID=A0A6C2YHA6_9BACT|nr:Uncharacterized protein OS=Gallibacterium anatis GN=IO45_12130 PE=4 SV=1 [Tuwongella immobilis]VTR97012.1 Uncharacterized protein OS=Gallibacterium anatis GN=IO45_12130 PE=4 SV=1 [Tuwongella immobilis]